MNDFAVPSALGRRTGLTDQYLRVWRLILIQQQGAASAMGFEVPEIPYAPPSERVVMEGQLAGGAVQTFEATALRAEARSSNQAIFSSEQPTGQYPGIHTQAAGLRIHFTVSQTSNSTPNTAEITIYNIAEKTVTNLIREFNYCILQAGYLYGQAGTIFSGSIKMYKTGHENVTDSYLKLYCADGEESMNGAVVNLTYPPGTEPRQQLDDFVKSLQQAGNVVPGPVDESTIRVSPNMRSDVKFGMTQDHLRDFAQANGAIWYVLHQRFHWASPSSYEEGSVVNLTSATGLIGFPEMTQDGINLTCLINPAIRLRQRIRLDNKTINQYWTPGGESGATYVRGRGTSSTMEYYLPVQADGIYMPLVINYEGDSRGQQWFQYMICAAVDSSAESYLTSWLSGFNWSMI